MVLLEMREKVFETPREPMSTCSQGLENVLRRLRARHPQGPFLPLLLAEWRVESAGLNLLLGRTD